MRNFITCYFIYSKFDPISAICVNKDNVVMTTTKWAHCALLFSSFKIVYNFSSITPCWHRLCYCLQYVCPICISIDCSLNYNAKVPNRHKYNVTMMQYTIWESLYRWQMLLLLFARWQRRLRWRRLQWSVHAMHTLHNFPFLNLVEVWILYYEFIWQLN